MESEPGPCGESDVLRHLLEANERLRAEIAACKRSEEDLLKARQAAEAANFAKSKFLAQMTHELRTPVNVMIGMTGLLLRGDLTTEQREYLRLLKESGESLLNIVSDVLDFSKIEAGQLTLEAIPFSLRESVGDSLKLLSMQAFEKNLDLEYEIASDMPDRVVADPVRLRQVLLNLVGNAIKFTERGEVVVRVEPESVIGDEVVCHFTVADSGIGIAPEKLHAIFAPFQQGGSSISREYGGTGLGLTISAQLVGMMKGRIWVESELGRGSRFHFSAHLRLQSGSLSEEETIDLKGLRVLVAESHPVCRRFVGGLLRQWGAEVHDAGEVENAMQLMIRAGQSSLAFDLAILDERMPGANIRDVSAPIGLRPDGRQPAVILLGSGPTNKRFSNRHDPAAPVHRLIRPIKQSELVAALRSLAILPAQEVPESAIQAPEVPLTILVVEDHAGNRLLTLRLLQSAGHAVTVVKSGLEALEKLQTQRFDLILMDLQMPGLDGIETTRVIRTREALGAVRVPILALTAHAVAGVRERCLEAGMDGYMIKPIRPAALSEAVRQARAMPPGDGPAGEPEASVVLDREALLERVNGDAHLLAEIVGLFSQHCDELMAQLQDAMRKGEARRFSRDAHDLAGMFGNLSALAARELAQMLEELDLEAQPAMAEEGYARLVEEVRVLRVNLAALRAEAIAGSARL